jgi:TRAP-type uncharacterized transport system substrate-binding protein
MASDPAAAQKARVQEDGTEVAIKSRINAWTVGLVGGLIEGTYMLFADEIRKVVDDEDEMRVLPIVSRGAAANLEDLLYLRGVDVAVTQVDVFEYFRTKRKNLYVNFEDRVNYILRFPAAETHLIVRNEIQNIEQLRGKKVHFATEGSSGSMTGIVMFQRLGIEVEPVFGNIIAGYEQLRKGEVDAALRVVQKPVSHIRALPANAGLKLLPIPFSRKFTDLYTLGEFTNADYPNLVQPGERIDTIAAPSVLAVYNWPKNTDRYRRVERFIQRLFANFDKLQKPPYHPKWKDVNLAATVPGWKRFPVAEEQLQQLASLGTSQENVNREFQTFLNRLEAGRAPRTAAEREALFREFLQWRNRRGQ